MSESTGSSSYLERLASRRKALQKRAQLVSAIRSFFDGQGYLEVETPLLLSTVAPEEFIEPMECDGRYLATSPELEMKALVAAGYGSIYQVTRSFRRGEHGRKHSPEFTILEWYRHADTLDALLSDLERLMRHCVQAVTGGQQFVWCGRPVDVSGPLRVIHVRDAYLRYAGWDPVLNWDADRFDVDMAERVEPNLGQGGPEALAYYPAQAASLARLWPQDPRLAQRVELYVHGLELANGFVELTDAAEQSARFAESAAYIERLGRRAPPLPARFLEILPKLPDTVGMALGVDRLAMLLCDVSRLDEVRAFDFLEV